MVSEPIFSVIVPVYNAEGFLDACVQSVLAQTVECFELILVNDGSADKSGIIVDTWAMTDERIRAVHQPNQGAAAARNHGVAEAKGNYITFVDADDLITEDYLEYLYAILCDSDADISVGGYKKVYPSDKILKRVNLEDKSIVMSGKEAMGKLLYQDGFMSVPWGMLIKKAIAEKVTFPVATKAEDMGTIYRFFYAADKLVKGSREIYYYYQRPGNTIYTTMSERNIDYYKHSYNMVKFVKENCPELIKAAFSRHFSTCFQILSETGIIKGNRKFIRRIYVDIRKMQNGVLKDKSARITNRVAAAISLISVTFIHLLLNCMYFYKMRKLKRQERNLEING